MAIERKFIKEAMKKVKVDKFIHDELSRVGCGNIDIKRVPLGTRVIISARKPGLVIGRKGKTVQTLTESLKNKFGVENPQIEVLEVPVPELDPEIMSKQLAERLEGGLHFRRAAYQMIRQILSAGALGVQIDISGKISGSRARNEKFRNGYMKYCGETANIYVREAVTEAKMKAGVLGIKIKIVPPFEGTSIQELELFAPDISDDSVEAISEEVPAETDKTKNSSPSKKKKTAPKKSSKKHEGAK